jgi:hypothetical protein
VLTYASLRNIQIVRATPGWPGSELGARVFTRCEIYQLPFGFAHQSIGGTYNLLSPRIARISTPIGIEEKGFGESSYDNGAQSGTLTTEKDRFGIATVDIHIGTESKR